MAERVAEIFAATSATVDRQVVLVHELNGGGGGVEYSGLLKKRNLLIFRNAQNARNGRFASNWNVSGTRFFGQRWELRELTIGSISRKRLSGLGTACIFKS